MTQAEDERAAEEWYDKHGDDLFCNFPDPEIGVFPLVKKIFLAGAEHAGGELEKLTSELIAQAACGREQGAREMAEMLLEKYTIDGFLPSWEAEECLQLWREGRK